MSVSAVKEVNGYIFILLWIVLSPVDSQQKESE